MPIGTLCESGTPLPLTSCSSAADQSDLTACCTESVRVTFRPEAVAPQLCVPRLTNLTGMMEKPPGRTKAGPGSDMTVRSLVTVGLTSMATRIVSRNCAPVPEGSRARAEMRISNFSPGCAAAEGVTQARRLVCAPARTGTGCASSGSWQLLASPATNFTVHPTGNGSAAKV